MINLLIISNKYALIISKHWSHAFASSFTIFCVITILSLSILCYTSSAKYEKRHTSDFVDTIHGFLSAVAMMLLIIVVFISAGNTSIHDVNHASWNSPFQDGSHSAYASHKLPVVVVHEIHHNRCVMPREWKYDELLDHHIGIKPNHDHVRQFQHYMTAKHHQAKYQDMILRQQDFDGANQKYCTKKYFHNPTWINYL